MIDGSKQLLIGTKLVAEGISIPNLKMVILTNFYPNILEFIQIAGRLREAGLCHILKGRRRVSSWKHPRLPLIGEGCLATQVRDFYNLELASRVNPHSGCCGAVITMPEATRDLLRDVRETAATVGSDESFRYQSSPSSNSTLANRLPFRTVEAKRFKTNFHGWEAFSDVFKFLGFTGSFRESLFLYGVDIHFCPWEVFTAYGKCKNCLKDRYLCLCPPGTRGKSYRDIAIEILAVHRIILNDEKNEVHLKKIEPYFKDPFPYLDQFYKKKEKFYQKVLLKYYWYLNLLSL
ncbi:hypothetical protein HG537_0H00110 [Torulaspora globosa]|uniref:Helicase C-terminal domain-containing protein n=1 Tax=Torulaspora globosa TaxID=48254 RepID=A0A7H9HRM8_9SACH|nr:hypothetical protein HG537_0C06590 [Torulaspora sp. CBS 2947]QLQ82250.1 hypothetical protein HG537_0H00110 [Torulaspora sp. CBS 2947]